MDAINKCKCLISPQISVEMILNGRIPFSAWIRLRMMYATLCSMFLMAMFGGCFADIPFNTGGWITALGFIGTLWLISIINPHMELPRDILLNVAAFFFGATVAPLINLFIQIHQSIIIKIFLGGVVFFSCHFGAARVTSYREIIYRIGAFCSPIFITYWMIISDTYSSKEAHMVFLFLLPLQWHLADFLQRFFINPQQMWFTVPFHLGCVWLLCYFFDYPLSNLVNVYLLVVPLIVHTQMHSQHVVAHHNKESYIVNTTISFFTDFPLFMPKWFKLTSSLKQPVYFLR